MCKVSGHMGPSPINTNTRFPHFCPIRIVAQCPDTWVRVQLVQIPELHILASSELLFSVWTHWPDSNRFKYPIPTFLPDHNCCTVSGHMGPSPFSSNTQFRHFCHIIICWKPILQIRSVLRPIVLIMSDCSKISILGRSIKHVTLVELRGDSYCRAKQRPSTSSNVYTRQTP